MTREKMMTLARIGDSIETTVRQPTPGTLRAQLQTAQACAEANKLLSDPKSGWTLAKPAGQQR
jgi:hypothetical protein